ncbi:MAG: DNA-3-methyladenine glycosylase [Ilumatobacteraceae bacterium]
MTTIRGLQRTGGPPARTGRSKPSDAPKPSDGERRLERGFFERGSVELAPLLLNKVLVAGPCAGRIVEVEAYRSDDPASHSYRGRTARNSVMFGPAGHLYVYFTYGMHFCANVVAATEGDAQAVLLRAVTPTRGIELMRERRRGRADRILADGPGKLCQAFGIDRSNDGVDLCADDHLSVVDDGVAPPTEPRVTTRIGIRVATEQPWRWLA